jgi:RNA polymerase sigma factor (sigma-70 family)
VGVHYFEMPDSELWHRAGEYDGQAFGELFDRHSSAVYNHCFRRTASWSMAEDLTSVVFPEAWRRRRDVRLHTESILPWLLAVANNALRNSARSIRRHQGLLAKLPQAEARLDNDATERIDEELSMAQILVHIRAMRIEEQEVIALCDWSALSHEEAATALGVPVGTVKSRLSRAHEYLRTRATSRAQLAGSEALHPRTSWRRQRDSS